MKSGITRLGSYTWLQAGDPLDLICGHMLQVGGIVTFDLETTGLDPWFEDILLIAFTQDGVNSFVFDPRELDPAPFIRLVQTVPINNHNLREFDGYWVRVKYGVSVNYAWDTMLAYQLATPGLGQVLGGASLDTLSQRYLGLKLEKKVRESFLKPIGEFQDAQISYAAEDTQASHRLIPITRALVEEAGHLSHMMDIEIPHMKVLEDMQVAGVPFNREVAIAFRDTIQDRVDELKEHISDALAYDDTVKKKCPECKKGTVTTKCPENCIKGKRRKRDGGGDCPSCNSLGRNVYPCNNCDGTGIISSIERIKPSPSSRLQLVKAFAAIGVKVPLVDRDNGETTESVSEESLELINHPIAEKLIELVKLNKAVTGFLVPLTKTVQEGGHYNTITGCIHTIITSCYTDTLRECVAGDTILNTSEGEFKISELPEDRFPKLGIVSHTGRWCQILHRFYKGELEMFKVTTEGGHTITGTKGHTLLTPYGWMKIEDLEVGFLLKTISESGGRKNSIITSIEPVGIQGVWDIEVEGDHSYLAQGLFHHNSSRDPNLQNIPGKQEFRDLFQVDDRFRIVDGDLSQYEVRVIAEESGDPHLKDLFDSRAAELKKLDALLDEIDEVVYTDELGAQYPKIKEAHERVSKFDVHSLIACKVNKLDPLKTDLTSEDFKAKRKNNKSVTFGIPYGAEAPTIAKAAKITYEEAQEAKDMYLNTFAKVPEFIEAAHEASTTPVQNNLAKLLGYPTLRLGRTTSMAGTHRYYILPSTVDDETKRHQIKEIHRQASNQPIQGLNARVIKAAKIYLHELLKEIPGAQIRLSIHDEILTTCNAGDEKRVARALKEAFHKASSKYLKIIPTEVGIGVSQVWQH